MGPYGCLVTGRHKKNIYKDYVGVDACACNLRPAMYGAYHHITVMGKENSPEDHLYDVVGGCNNDKFAIDRWLPQTDIIISHNHIQPTHSIFNACIAMEVCPVVRGTKLIRRRNLGGLFFNPFLIDSKESGHNGAGLRMSKEGRRPPKCLRNLSITITETSKAVFSTGFLSMFLCIFYFVSDPQG